MLAIPRRRWALISINTSGVVSVLVVDEDELRLASIRTQLEAVSIGVVGARSGEEALRRAAGSPFAAVVMDMQMRGTDCLETARLLKLRATFAATPFIFVISGPLGEEDERRAYEAGGIDLIERSRIPHLLLPKLRAYITASEMALAANELIRTQSEFLSMAAHELRGPLGVTHGYVTMLIDGSLGEMPPGWSRPLQVVADKLIELGDLLEDVFITSRLDAGQDACRCLSVDLDAEVARAVSRAAARVERLGAELRFERPRYGICALANPSHLARILDNLINNGLSYSGDRPRLSISVTDEAGPKVTVSDCGAGIPAEMRERVFERAVRYSHPTLGTRSGSGLGLYISRRLAELQGGELVIETSQVGEGSRFTLSLSPVNDSTSLQPAG